MKATLIALCLSLCFSLAAEDVKLKIGVVDMGRVVEEYERSIAMLTLLEKRRDEVQAEAVKVKGEIEEMQKSINIVGRAKREQIFNLIRKKKIELKVSQEAFREEINFKREQFYIEVYKDIQSSLEVFAKEKGFDFLFRKNLPKSRPDIQMKEGIVIYNSKKFDVTDDVLKMLNMKFRQQQLANSQDPSK